MRATLRASDAPALACRRGACVLALLAAGFLAACAPELDWREVASPEGGYAALFPAKPELESREVTIGGTRLALTMASVRKAGMAFGVAHAELSADGADRARLLDAARDALVRNIGGRITAERTVAVGGYTAREFVADGTAGGEPMHLAARVLAADRRFYQVVFIGREERAAEADVNLFLGSFRLLGN